MAEKIVYARVQNGSDTAENWSTNNPVLLAGEIGIENDTKLYKFGDGVTAWNDLDYAGTDAEQVQGLIDAAEDNFYAVTAEGEETDATALTEIDAPKKGDIAVVKRTIANDKVSHTAYVYNGSAWEAADGNYNAENVYFGKDLTITANIGVQTVGSSGSKTLATAGKNVKEVFDMIMAAEKNPAITQPYATLTVPQVKSYEVGSKVTPTYTASLNPGSYQYGPATGVTATAYNVADNGGSENLDTSSGSFPELTVADDTSYFISVSITHTGGAIPKTNLNNDYAAGAIQAGTKISSSGNITGYRNSFYGTTTSKEVETTSSVIRGLSGKSNKALANGATFKVSIPVGALRVLIAYPATLREVTSIKDDNAMSAEIKTGFTMSTVSVEGANGYNGINYRVYTMDFASANDTANTYTVTI